MQSDASLIEGFHNIFMLGDKSSDCIKHFYALSSNGLLKRFSVFLFLFLFSVLCFSAMYVFAFFGL